MTMSVIVRAEAVRTSYLLVAGGVLGAMLGSALVGVCLGLALLLAIHLWSAARLLAWHQSPKRNELPQGYGLWAQIYDATLERHRRSRTRKKRLTAIVKEFRASTAALPDAAVVLDEPGRITWFNLAAQQMLGLTLSRDQGQRITNLLRHPRFVSYLLQQGSPETGVEIPAPENTAITLWVRVIPYGHEQRLLIARDISERKRIEALRRDFVGNASHELRTPLTVINGYLDMMVANAGQADELAPWSQPLNEMQRQSLRMESIIRDMLKLARLETGRRPVDMQPLAMPELLRQALREAEVLSDGRHTLSAEIDDELDLMGQPEEIQSVANNLLSNAIRYTQEGGQITLRWRAQGAGAVLEVEDSGIGIAASDIPRLTERFYRADIARSRDTGGTGLGLAIVKHALERHGATLGIESRVGRGSVFRCQFPLAEPDPP